MKMHGNTNPQAIKEFRARHDLTQKQCADMLYISERQWRNIESGKTPLSMAHLVLLSLLTDSNTAFRKRILRRVKLVELFQAI